MKEVSECRNAIHLLSAIPISNESSRKVSKGEFRPTRKLLPLAITKGVILMNKMLIYPLPKFHTLPATLPIEGAIRIEIEEGNPILRASKSVQTRIEELIQKNQDVGLTKKESEELDQYEEIDDYLSFFNRVVRNLLRAQSEET